MTEPRFVTCQCRHCNGNIEFDANQLDTGECRAVDCPHCHQETLIIASIVEAFVGLKAPLSSAPSSAPIHASPPKLSSVGQITIPQVRVASTRNRQLLIVASVAAPFLLLCLVIGLFVLHRAISNGFGRRSLSEPPPLEGLLATKVPYSVGFKVGYSQDFTNMQDTGWIGPFGRTPAPRGAQLKSLGEKAILPENAADFSFKTQSDKLEWLEGFKAGVDSCEQRFATPYGKGYFSGWIRCKGGDLKYSDEVLEAKAREWVGPAHKQEYISGYEDGWSDSR